MLFDIDLDISKEELAKKLGIPVEDISERGRDFEALMFDECDFDSCSEEEYENIPTHLKMKVIGDAIYSNRDIDEYIAMQIQDEISSRKKKLMEWDKEYA